MHTSSDIQLPAAGRRRGRYPDAFKAQLAAGAKPRYDTMLKLLHALEVKLSVTHVHS